MERHPNSARFHEILKELGDLHDKKQGDYGRNNDPFANVRSSTEWGVKPWVGAMIRANDKVRRLQSLIQNGKLNNESAEDSLRDLAVYSIISLVLFEEETYVHTFSEEDIKKQLQKDNFDAKAAFSGFTITSTKS